MKNYIVLIALFLVAFGAFAQNSSNNPNATNPNSAVPIVTHRSDVPVLVPALVGVPDPNAVSNNNEIVGNAVPKVSVRSNTPITTANVTVVASSTTNSYTVPTANVVTSTTSITTTLQIVEPLKIVE